MTANEPARQYLVEGMTCSHCVASVREEVSKVAAVSASTSTSTRAASSS